MRLDRRAAQRGTHNGNGKGPEHWEWSDGSPWEFEFWGPGEPIAAAAKIASTC